MKFSHLSITQMQNFFAFSKKSPLSGIFSGRIGALRDPRIPAFGDIAAAGTSRGFIRGIHPPPPL